MSTAGVVIWMASDGGPSAELLQAAIDAAHSVDEAFATAAAVKAYEDALASTVEGRDRLARLTARNRTRSGL